MNSVKIPSAASCATNGQPSLLERLRAWENDPVMQRIQPKGMPHLYGNEDSRWANHPST